MSHDFLCDGSNQSDRKDEMPLDDIDYVFDLFENMDKNQGNLILHFHGCILFIQLNFIC